MDFSAQLENSSSKPTKPSRASGRRAPSPGTSQQRIDQAQVDANLALMDVKQQAEQTSDQVQSKWAQVKADSSAWMDDIKAKIDKRSDQRDAKAAAKDADRAERDAVDAMDYAVVASTVRSWRCSMRWTRAPMQTSGPRSLGRRPWEGLPAIGARAMTCNSVSMRVVEACIGLSIPESCG